MSQIHKYDFTFEDLPSTKLVDKKGWYLWYVDWSSAFHNSNLETFEIRICIENIIKFYCDKPIFHNSKAMGYEFGEKYEGHLRTEWKAYFKSEENQISNITNNPSLFYQWLSLITINEIPIYFGKSIDLYSRLKQHISSLSDPNLLKCEDF